MEVLVGAPQETGLATRSFLDRFTIITLTGPIAERAVAIRRQRRIKLPDAIILASADTHSLLLVTRNTKDFPPGDPGIRMPYQV